MSSNKGAALDDASEMGGYPPNTAHYMANQVGTAPPGVVVNQPQAMPPVGGVNQTVIIQHSGGKTWSTTLCSCMSDMESCCCVWWCGPCYECWFHSKNNESCCTPICVPGATIALRTKLRTQHNIMGSIMDDCCVVCCCSACALCQMKREYDILQRGQVVTTVTTATMQHY